MTVRKGAMPFQGHDMQIHQAESIHRKDILLVEDSGFQRKSIRRLLNEWDYDVAESTDGEKGLRDWEQHAPRLVLTDLHMPGMDGLELIKQIRKREYSYTYIIVLSGMNDKESIVSALSAGADDYLIKPVLPEELKVRLMAADRLIRLQSQDLLIFSLARLADYRSPETGYHLERVQHYTRLLAEDLANNGNKHLTPARIGIYANYSSLHDIGKVAIPDSILNKPGKLTEKEYETMKSHAIIGGELIHGIYIRTGAEQLRIARDIVMYHHEKFNGTGYPYALKSEDIPLPARIVALADVFDALSGKRVYKESFSNDKCKEIILSESGKHFDPEVVEAYLRQESSFNAIKERFKDS